MMVNNLPPPCNVRDGRSALYCRRRFTNRVALCCSSYCIHFLYSRRRMDMLVLEYMIYNIIPCSYAHPSAVGVWKHPWRYSWEHTHERCVSIQEHQRQCLQSATTESHVCEKARWKAAGDAIRQDHRAHQENVLRPESGVCGPGTATHTTRHRQHIISPNLCICMHRRPLRKRS